MKTFSYDADYFRDKYGELEFQFEWIDGSLLRFEIDNDQYKGFIELYSHSLDESDSGPKFNKIMKLQDLVDAAYTIEITVNNIFIDSLK